MVDKVVVSVTLKLIAIIMFLMGMGSMYELLISLFEATKNTSTSTYVFELALCILFFTSSYLLFFKQTVRVINTYFAIVFLLCFSVVSDYLDPIIKHFIDYYNFNNVFEKSLSILLARSG